MIDRNMTTSLSFSIRGRLNGFGCSLEKTIYRWKDLRAHDDVDYMLDGLKVLNRLENISSVKIELRDKNNQIVEIKYYSFYGDLVAVDKNEFDLKTAKKDIKNTIKKYYQLMLNIHLDELHKAIKAAI